MTEMAYIFGVILVVFAGWLLIKSIGMTALQRMLGLSARKQDFIEMPASYAELKADQEQRRADCMLSTQKLESSFDEVKQKIHDQVSEIEKKDEQLRVLMLEAEATASAVKNYEEREQALKLEIRNLESGLEDMTRKFQEAEKKANEAQAVLAEREKNLNNSQSMLELRSSELASLNLKILHLETDDEARQEALAKTERALAEERAASKSTTTKIEALERTLQSKAQQVGQLQAKVSELTAQLRAQMAETERAITKAQSLLGERNKIDEEMARRASDAESRINVIMQDMEKTRSERASLEGQLSAAREERNRLAQDMKLVQANNDVLERDRPAGTIWPQT